jgi:hypothetical protein
MAQFASKAPDVSHDLLVRSEDARDGSTYTHTVIWTIGCEACEGSGVFRNRPCASCAGAGYTERHHTYSVKVPPNTREGQKLRLAGCGFTSKHAGQAPGDLFLTVRFFGDGVIRQELPAAQAATAVEARKPGILGAIRTALSGDTQRALK